MLKEHKLAGVGRTRELRRGIGGIEKSKSPLKSFREVAEGI